MRRRALTLALVGLAACRVAVESPPRTAPATPSRDVDVSTLVRMVKQRPLNLAGVRPLLGATFSGDAVRLSSMRVAPLEPGILVDSFDEWRFAARLQLLMDYASWQLARERPRVYGGVHAEKARRLDEQSDLRIATLVRETGYDEAWRPFIAVYVDLHREVSENALEYRSENGDDDAFDMMFAIDIDEIARSHLEGVIEAFPMDASVVAAEMLRLLEWTRGMLGVSGPDEPDRLLFHGCGTGEESTVVTNAAHPLATVLSVAYEADNTDAAANEIKASYRNLVIRYESWARKHTTASLEEQRDFIRGLTERLQLVKQLESYRVQRD